jgi:hypothetical protein
VGLPQTNWRESRCENCSVEPLDRSRNSSTRSDPGDFIEIPPGARFAQPGAVWAGPNASSMCCVAFQIAIVTTRASHQICTHASATITPADVLTQLTAAPGKSISPSTSLTKRAH